MPRLASSFSISYALSKWSSIARLWRPVTKIISVRPAATASSTAYWMSGLSTTGIISFGLALVAGRKRLPKPATGNTAFVIARISSHPSSSRRRPASSSTATPSASAFASLDPASAPATT